MIRTRRPLCCAQQLRRVVWIIIALALACSDSELEPRALRPLAWPSGDLVDVAVPAADLAIVVSASGRFHTTRNAGLTWRAARVPAVGPLRGISMAGPRIGWAFGTGVILATEDGGENWRRQRLPGRASDLDLTGLAAIDEERALVVGRGGSQLRTIDGGAVWQGGSLEARMPGTRLPSFVDIECALAGAGRCWTLGREIRFSGDGGASWQTLEIEDELAIEPIDFAFGLVEVPKPAVLRIREALARRPRAANLRWRIDAGLSAREVDRIGDESDPSALFALIEARVEEVRLVLEALGVGEDEIETVEVPPWDYEDRVDDDPDILSRYWARRVTAGARSHIHTREKISVTAIDVDALGFGIAVGRSGRGLRSDRADRVWRPLAVGIPHELLGVAATGKRIVAVGLQGGLWTSSDRGESWSPVEPEGAGVFFEALRSVAFAPEGRFGFVVGAHGRLLRSRDGGASWQALVAPAQADQLPFR
jgi:photosystem II stability/assembly factor-like uncharacterized protein